MTPLFQLGQSILANQPFSKVLGTELKLMEPGSVVLALKIQEQHKQQHGFVHGGVISYLADNALTFAGGSVLGDSVTSEYKINYLRPGLGHALEARAKVLGSGKKQAVCQCEVFALDDGGERLVAVAQGTISKAGE